MVVTKKSHQWPPDRRHRRCLPLTNDSGNATFRELQGLTAFVRPQSCFLRPAFEEPLVEAPRRLTWRKATRYTLKRAHEIADSGNARTARMRRSKPSSSSSANAATGSGD